MKAYTRPAREYEGLVRRLQRETDELVALDNDPRYRSAFLTPKELADTRVCHVFVFSADDPAWLAVRFVLAAFGLKGVVERPHADVVLPRVERAS